MQTHLVTSSHTERKPVVVLFVLRVRIKSHLVVMEVVEYYRDHNLPLLAVPQQAAVVVTQLMVLTVVELIKPVSKEDQEDTQEKRAVEAVGVLPVAKATEVFLYLINAKVVMQVKL